MEEQANTDFLNSLLIVLVIYEMKITESPTYQSLTAALIRQKKSTSLFIYDNSLLRQQSLTDQCWEWQYVHDPSNPGVSKAYNEGFKKAKELNKKWLLLVDQDTVFPENCFDNYYKCISGFKQQIVVPILRDKIGIVSPFKFYFGGGARLRELSDSEPLNLKDYYFINSGLLIDVSVFEVAGGYDENLPLDFSDIAFICRLRNTVEHFVVMEISCEHQLSGTEHRDVSHRLKRFETYVTASRYMMKRYSFSKWISIRAFVRAIKLSFQHVNFKFLVLFFK